MHTSSKHYPEDIKIETVKHIDVKNSRWTTSFLCRIYQNASLGYDLMAAAVLRRLTTSTGGTPAYLLVQEVAPSSTIHPLSFIKCCSPPCVTQASPLVNTRTLFPKSFDLDEKRPFVPVLSEKVRARRGRTPKDEVRLIPLTDISYVRQMSSWMVTTRPRPREPLWAVTGEPCVTNWSMKSCGPKLTGFIFRFRWRHIR